MSKASEGLCCTASSLFPEALQYDPSDGKSPGAVEDFGDRYELNDYRPVALTSHIMKTLERLFVRRMRLQVAEDLDPLQFAYQKHIGVEDTILYMLHWAGCAWFICESRVL